MSEVTYAVLSLTSDDLDRIFLNCPRRGLSKFRRMETVRKFLWQSTFIYFDRERQIPNFDRDRDIDFETQTTIDFILGRLSKAEFIEELTADAKWSDKLYGILNQKT